MDMKKFIIQMLSAKSGNVSSKRCIGVLAWLVILGILIVCAYRAQEAPSMTDSVIIAASGLLGIDSVTNAFKKDE